MRTRCAVDKAEGGCRGGCDVGHMCMSWGIGDCETRGEMGGGERGDHHNRRCRRGRGICDLAGILADLSTLDELTSDNCSLLYGLYEVCASNDGLSVTMKFECGARGDSAILHSQYRLRQLRFSQSHNPY